MNNGQLSVVSLEITLHEDFQKLTEKKVNC